MTPKKIIIEPTTRCNFKCEMCVKQSLGCRIREGDMDSGVFDSLVPLLDQVTTLIFTGIGEPLLHGKLENWLTRARDKMPKDSTRGFQTNGKLLTRARALSLVRAGLNKICISVDASDPELFNTLRSGGSLTDVESGLVALEWAKKAIPDSGLKIGIEFVLMKKNMDQLPHVVAWAGEKHLDFMLVTHVTAYEKQMEKEQAFMDNSHEGLALFKAFQKKAAQKDIDLNQYNKILWKFYKTKTDEDIYTLVQDLKTAALEKDLYINLFHLLDEDAGYYKKVHTLFEEARQTAEQFNLDLTLPAIRPKTDRYCPFVEEDAMFVTWEGQVSPCYFLWHGYTTMRAGYIKTVNPVFFGNVKETDPKSIWTGEDYAGFRTKVKNYDYPNCHAWCETRCDYVLDDPFYQDCFINDIPCCDCQWNLGFLNCMN